MTVYRPKNSPNFHYDFVFKGERYNGSTGCRTKRAAEEYERRERQKAALPEMRRPPISLDEACGLYQEHAEKQPSWPTTKYMLAALIKGLGGNRPLSEISQRELQVFFAKRRDGRSNSTVNREIENTRAVWFRAKKARYNVGEMPEWKALFLKVPKRPPNILEQGAAEDALFDSLPADAYDVVMFALISGWRKSEVINLRWADCNLPRAEAVTLIKGGDTVIRPLTPSLVALIANQPRVGPLVWTYVCRKSRAKRRAGHRYPMTVTALRTRWRDAKEAAELQGLRFHDLRHTAATRILAATQNLAVTKEALKHSNIKTTLRYAHVLHDDVREALSAVESRKIPEGQNAVKRKG